MNDFYAKSADHFKYGWEVELMVTNKEFTPLYGDNIPFDSLHEVLASVPVDDIGYLKEKYVGSGLRPYYIEGYDAGYDGSKVRNVHVKGIEIRTPVTFSIEESVRVFEDYYTRMNQVMEKMGLHLSCFGTHPFQPAFKGERGRRSVIDWASAETAMTTHGLVINISLPDAMEATLDRDALNNRFSYASPAMVLFSANTPFKDGALWQPGGQQAFSERSFRRSFTRNTVYYRDDQHHRKEITLFDMTNNLSLYSAYAALSLGIILSEEQLPVIPDRFSKENIRRVTLQGYEATLMDRHFLPMKAEDVAHRVLSMCTASLVKHGFKESLLAPLWAQLERKETPAHRIIAEFNKSKSIQSVLENRSQLVRMMG